MQVRFLLGPAGSGKTFRCLAEIRAALKDSPEGLPLLLLAPKQATFQLERQLLSDSELTGYTRLQILSFDRLARFLLEQLLPVPPRLLDEEGRLMVLRALLAQKQSELQLFRATARLPGFAQQLSQLLRELQRHQLTPERLLKLREKVGAVPQLSSKLHDLALILSAYQSWLAEHKLHDADRVLDLATAALREIRQPSAAAFRLGGLWLDGFAEMTPQELDLLTTLIPCCDNATIAFCLDTPAVDTSSWLTPWSVVGKTFNECRQRIEVQPGCEIDLQVLPRRAAHSRFVSSAALRHLEQFWTTPRPFTGNDSERAQVRLFACANPEAEATLAAREVLHLVHQGGRFRDAAVLVRQLDGYHDALQRVFTRYEIPFFLDRREAVSHHPLAELTRNALRLAAFQWQHEDWFGALKSGLVPAEETAIDELENEALAHGWHGNIWREPLETPEEKRQSRVEQLERVRARVVPPFQHLVARLEAVQYRPSGKELAEALRGLWTILDVEKTLEAWTERPIENRSQFSTLHKTVWEQMQTWLDNIERAFSLEVMPLREWLPVLEAGLAGLTVGVIPPSLDQVLIGAVDRSRNPELKLAVILGLNETLFPAPPKSANLLSDADRAALENASVFLGLNTRQRLAHERYFGYIACTRSGGQLTLAYSLANANGQAMNPSPFIAHLQRLFPALKPAGFTSAMAEQQPEHPCELMGAVLRASGSGELAEFAALPPFAPVVAKHTQVIAGLQAAKLSPESVATLYGSELRSSVSALEDYAACPFKFFVARGLSAKERENYEVDVREKGSFQHAILDEFHRGLQSENKRWRDLTPEQARERVRVIGESLLSGYRHGLFETSTESRFAARVLIEDMQQLMATLVGWMDHYAFDPQAVELNFGLGDQARLPGWRLDLENERALVLRGRIDRIDLCPVAGTDAALAVVMDYKSSGKKLDALKLYNGLELQLLSYLSVLRHLGNATELLGVGKLIPTGVFYIGLKGKYESESNRTEALANRDEVKRTAYQHTGRFNKEEAGKFDTRPGADTNDQFKLSLKSKEGLEPQEFVQLLDDVEAHLRRIGNEIFAGNVDVAPYRKSSETACERCDYRGICRFDEWTEPYRALKTPPKTEKNSIAAKDRKEPKKRKK